MDTVSPLDDNDIKPDTACRIPSRECKMSVSVNEVPSMAKSLPVSEGDIADQAVIVECEPPPKKARYESHDNTVSAFAKSGGREKRWTSDRAVCLTIGQGSKDLSSDVVASAHVLPVIGQRYVEPSKETLHASRGRRGEKESKHFPDTMSLQSVHDSLGYTRTTSESSVLSSTSSSNREGISYPDSHPALCCSRTDNPDSSIESDDDRMDASNLVLSVIKTKVDIQTMKMCLRHNADAFSSRALGLPVSVTAVPSSSVHPLSGSSSSGHTTPDVEQGGEPVAGPSGLSSSQCGDERGEQRYPSCVCNHTEHCTCTARRQGLASPRVEGAVPGRCAGHLEHWQDQHTAKAIVDNAINRTIEEMVVAPDHSASQVQTVRFDQEDEVTSGQEHRFFSRDQQPIQSLQDRLEPVINQLTQASELVFARNIEHSRSTSLHDRLDDVSPVDCSVDP